MLFKKNMYSTDSDLKNNSFKHTSEVQFPFKKKNHQISISAHNPIRLQFFF